VCPVLRQLKHCNFRSRRGTEFDFCLQGNVDREGSFLNRCFLSGFVSMSTAFGNRDTAVKPDASSCVFLAIFVIRVIFGTKREKTNVAPVPIDNL